MTKRLVKTSKAVKGFKTPKLTKSLGQILREAVVMSEEEMWAQKRAFQKRNEELIKSGKMKPQDFLLFPPGAAKRAKILNGPY